MPPTFDPLTELMPTSGAAPTPPPMQPPAPTPPLENSAAHDAARSKLDLRLTAVLRGAARGFGYEAAELWLLDDATRRLTRRLAWGVGADREAPARTLEEADADLAALAGGAVVLENRSETRDWPLPRPAVSATCLPVSSDRTIHGVLWFFGSNERDLDDLELEVLEIIAGRFAMEIERDMLMR